MQTMMAFRGIGSDEDTDTDSLTVAALKVLLSRDRKGVVGSG
jgi:hypothetical protein